MVLNHTNNGICVFRCKLSKANVFTLPEDSQTFRGDDSGDTEQALSRLLETWPELSADQRSLLVETAKQFMTTDSLMDLN